MSKNTDHLMWILLLLVLGALGIKIAVVGAAIYIAVLMLKGKEVQ